MRIGIDIAKALPPRDGVGNYTYHLTKALIALDGRHEYRLFASSPTVSRSAVEATFENLPATCEIAEPLTRTQDQVDLFHAPSWHYPLGHKGKVVLTCHDLTFLTHPQFHVEVNRIHCLRGTLEAVVYGAHFLCVSRHTRKQVHHHLGLPEERTSVIDEGYDPTFRATEVQAAAKRLRKRHGIEHPFILSVGSLEPRKNLVRLVKAYDGLDENLRRRHDLLLVGPSGWLNAALHEYLAERRGIGTIRLLGFVEREDQVDLYNAASVFVYPSLAEGFGLPVLEAMACGAPVATSSTTSLPEVVGDAALTFKPEDTRAIRRALHRILTEPRLSDDLRNRGLRRAQHFSWERAARETVELYERIAA